MRHRSEPVTEIEFDPSPELATRLEAAGIDARPEDISTIARRGTKRANEIADLIEHFARTLKTRQ